MSENNNDKRELLKLKQGLIAADDCTEIEVEKPPVYEKPTGLAGVQNFLYHQKLYIIIFAFFAVVVSVLLYFALTAEKADLTVLLIADNQETSAFLFTELALIKQAVEAFTPDFNNDKKVYVSCLFIDLVKEGRRVDYIQGNSTKLFGEVRSGKAMIYIGNLEALEGIPASGEMPIYDFYDEIIEVKGSALEKAADFDSEYGRAQIPEDLYIAIRKSADANSRTVWENIKDSGLKPY